MGFIDHDEFLVIRDPSAADLPSLLQRYEGKYGGIGVNWRLFGSSGQEQKPSGEHLVCPGFNMPLDWQF